QRHAEGRKAQEERFFHGCPRQGWFCPACSLASRWGSRPDVELFPKNRGRRAEKARNGRIRLPRWRFVRHKRPGTPKRRFLLKSSDRHAVTSLRSTGDCREKGADPSGLSHLCSGRVFSWALSRVFVAKPPGGAVVAPLG